MSDLIAKRLRLVHNRGEITLFTHVEFIHAENGSITIYGETDDVDGTRIAITEQFEIEDNMLLDVEFFIPKV